MRQAGLGGLLEALVAKGDVVGRCLDALAADLRAFRYQRRGLGVAPPGLRELHGVRGTVAQALDAVLASNARVRAQRLLRYNAVDFM